ncbi:MAG: flavodoxin [Spirochaetaceae bacterium]|nr:flavodoxin [Spirochaetaceae bacterium]
MNAVIYASRGGNTRKLADAVAGGAGVKAQAIADAVDLAQVDILFIGASLYAGRINKGLRQFLQALKEKQAAKAVVFGTSASGKSALAEIKSILESRGIPVSPEAFHCKGSFLCVNSGHPNTDDLARAGEFAKRVCDGGL